jgi:hypothetical protein
LKIRLRPKQRQIQLRDLDATRVTAAIIGSGRVDVGESVQEIAAYRVRMPLE